MTIAKPHRCFIANGAPADWRDGWAFPSPLPPGWPKQMPPYSCSLYVGLSPLGMRIKALWFDVDGEDPLQEIDGQFAHVRLWRGNKPVSFGVGDVANRLSWLGPIGPLDKGVGINISLAGQFDADIRADVEVFGHDGSLKSATPWGV